MFDNTRHYIRHPSLLLRGIPTTLILGQSCDLNGDKKACGLLIKEISDIYLYCMQIQLYQLLNIDLI